MRGDLSEQFSKGGQAQTRRLNADRAFTTPSGESLRLPGRSLMFVRNVGHLMTNPAILDREGHEIFEGIMDALFTTPARFMTSKAPAKAVIPVRALCTLSNPKCTAQTRSA